MTSTYLRSQELHDRGRSQLILIDLQERLMAALADAPEVVKACEILGDVARRLSIPVFVTEQYPQGLGPTVPPIARFASVRPAKQRFSAVEALAVPGVSDDPATRDQIILAGVETHVCVLQTAFDYLALGYRVTVVADAVTSRRSRDTECAIARMRDSGVTITTAESVIFEWCESAADPEFKSISGVVKSRGLRVDG